MKEAFDKHGKPLCLGTKVRFGTDVYEVLSIADIETNEQPGLWVIIKNDSPLWPLIVPSYLLEVIYETDGD